MPDSCQYNVIRLSPSCVHSTFPGVVFRLHFKCERVGRERARMSELIYNRSVDGKNDDSYEHCLENGISKFYHPLRL